MQDQEREEIKAPPIPPGEVLVDVLKKGNRIRVGNVVYKVTSVRPNGKATIKPMRAILIGT